MFWTKTYYLCMAFPFLLFQIPLIGKALTHARPTGYNKFGKCIPMDVGAQMPQSAAEIALLRQESDAEAKSRHHALQIADDADADDEGEADARV